MGKLERTLTKVEKFVCELTWGNVPFDISWILNSNLFKEKLKEFESGKFKDLWEYEIKNKTK